MSLIYRTGIESYVAYATENTTGVMLAPDSTSIGAAGGLTFALAGYTNVAGFGRSNALRRLRAAGMARPTTPRPGAKNASISLTPTLSGGTLSKAFINKALRETSGGAGTFKCMDVFALGIATKTNCGDGAATQELARCCQFNTLTLNISRDSFLNATADIWPLYIDPAGGGTMPTVNDTTIGVAGGNPFVFEDMTFTLGGTPLTEYIASAQININNMLLRMGTRPITQGAPFAFNPGQIVTTGEEITINLSLFDRIPSGVLSTYGVDAGALSIVLTDGIETMTIAASANWAENTGQNGGEATSQMTWSASLLSKDLSIT